MQAVEKKDRFLERRDRIIARSSGQRPRDVPEAAARGRVRDPGPRRRPGDPRARGALPRRPRQRRARLLPRRDFLFERRPRPGVLATSRRSWRSTRTTSRPSSTAGSPPPRPATPTRPRTRCGGRSSASPTRSCRTSRSARSAPTSRAGRTPNASSRRAIDAAPVPSAHILLGNVLREKGELTQAIQQFEEALRLAPESEEAVFQLGLCYLEKNWSKRALECFQQALEKNPRRLEYQEAVRLLERKGGYELPRVDGPGAAAFRDAEESAARGYLERAQELYRKAMRAEPRNPDDPRVIRAALRLDGPLERGDRGVPGGPRGGPRRRRRGGGLLARSPRRCAPKAIPARPPSSCGSSSRSIPRRRRRPSDTTSSRRAWRSRARTWISPSTTRGAPSRRRPRS